MKMNTPINKILVVCLWVFAIVVSIPANASDVVFVDVSGSVDGKGYNSEHLLPIMQRQLKDFSSTYNRDLKIVTFSNKIRSAIDSKDFVKELHCVKGNTNLIPAIESIDKYTNGTSPYCSP